MTIPAGADRMGCDGTRATTFAACDGELSEPELIAIDVHLQRCESCRVRLMGDAVFLRAIRGAVSMDAAPASLRERAAQLLQQHAAENVST